MFKIEYATERDIDDIMKIDTYIPKDELVKIELALKKFMFLKRMENGGCATTGSFGTIFLIHVLNVSETCRGKDTQKALLHWEMRCEQQAGLS